VRDHGRRADAEHLGEGEDDETEIARNANGGNGFGAESADPVQVDEKVQCLKDHGDEHEARGLQQMAREWPGCEILHGQHSARPSDFTQERMSSRRASTSQDHAYGHYCLGGLEHLYKRFSCD
jgi:hypothetical protein